MVSVGIVWIQLNTLLVSNNRILDFIGAPESTSKVTVCIGGRVDLNSLLEALDSLFSSVTSVEC